MIGMRKGSLEYWPHRRAKKVMPRMRSTPNSNTASFLTYAAFKAGMTHVMMIDDSLSPSKGTEVAKAVTVLEMPHVYVYGARFYRKGYAYKEVLGEAYDKKLAERLGIKKHGHSIDELSKRAAEFVDVSALAFLDPEGIGFGNKRLMRFEMPVGGGSAEDKLKFVQGFIGKELKAGDVIHTGEYIDVSSISKGKGWSGVIKRYGVSRQYRKATNKVRHVGTLGPWHPPKVMFGVPQAGHMGYNYRTELGKRVLKVGNASDAKTVNAMGGFLNYGVVRNDFMVVEGTIPGPSKRLVRIRKSLRRHEAAKELMLTYISTASKQGA